MDSKDTRGHFPAWLRRPLPEGGSLCQTYQRVKDAHIHTVCQEANCPNRAECFSKQVATFLACGNICTRNCAFCNISSGKSPLPIDPREVDRIVATAKDMGLQHIVITQVTRDDLPDGGASHIAAILRKLKEKIPSATREVLTSDFQGNLDSLSLVLEESPDIFNHNIETIERLNPKIRDKEANYPRSLNVLRFAKHSKKCRYIKSGLMVGLGESKEEVFQAIQDLADTGCDMITIGQYLSPSRLHFSVKRYVTPEEFKEYEQFGLSRGLQFMLCGPFVRSSYQTKEFLEKAFC